MVLKQLFVTAVIILHAALITQCSGKPITPPCRSAALNQSYDAVLPSQKSTECAKQLQEKANHGAESIETSAEEVRGI